MRGVHKGSPNSLIDAKPEVKEIKTKNKIDLQPLDTFPELEVSLATAGFIPSPPPPPHAPFTGKLAKRTEALDTAKVNLGSLLTAEHRSNPARLKQKLSVD